MEDNLSASVSQPRFRTVLLAGLALLIAAVAVLLTAVALTAYYIPARRATRVDPTVALRCE